MTPIGDTPKLTWLDQKWKKGGYSCDRCQTQLKHENLMGEYKDGMFHVRGYWCACGNELKPERKLVKFDWRRL